MGTAAAVVAVVGFACLAWGVGVGGGWKVLVWWKGGRMVEHAVWMDDVACMALLLLSTTLRLAQVYNICHMLANVVVCAM